MQSRATADQVSLFLLHFMQFRVYYVEGVAPAAEISLFTPRKTFTQTGVKSYKAHSVRRQKQMEYYSVMSPNAQH